MKGILFVSIEINKIENKEIKGLVKPKPFL